MNEEIDALAVAIEEQIQSNEEQLNALPVFRIGRSMRNGIVPLEAMTNND